MSILAILAGAIAMIFLAIYLGSRETSEEILVRKCFSKGNVHYFNRIPHIYELGGRSTFLLLSWLKKKKITPASLEATISCKSLEHLHKYVKNHTNGSQILEEYLTKK